MQDYLLRFAADKTTPTAEDWEQLVEGLFEARNDEDKPASRAWAHRTLLGLSEWYSPMLEPEEPDEETLERLVHALPRDPDRVQTWLTPPPLGPEARAIFHYDTSSVERVFSDAAWQGDGRQTLIEAANRRQHRRWTLYGSGAVILLVGLAFGIFFDRQEVQGRAS
jgi:hypothetical protein